VIVGSVPLVPPQINDDFSAILEWADAIRRLKVRTNADTPEDSAKAREFGRRGDRPLPHRAHVRDAERLHLMREMILAPTRTAAAPRSSACCRSSRRLRGDLRGDGGACR
jgi:pyruvate,orthophosphate dikinase